MFDIFWWCSTKFSDKPIWIPATFTNFIWNFPHLWHSTIKIYDIPPSSTIKIPKFLPHFFAHQVSIAQMPPASQCPRPWQTAISPAAEQKSGNGHGSPGEKWWKGGKSRGNMVKMSDVYEIIYWTWEKNRVEPWWLSIESMDRRFDLRCDGALDVPGFRANFDMIATATFQMRNSWDSVPIRTLRLYDLANLCTCVYIIIYIYTWYPFCCRTLKTCSTIIINNASNNALKHICNTCNKT